MAVFRVEKTKDYTIMSNEHLKDRRLSYKAKGLLSVMLSLPDDWDYSLKGLISLSLESETAVKSALKELENNGYLVIEKVKGDKGLFEYIYNIYETSKHSNPEGGFPGVENPEVDYPGVEVPGVENHVLLNTNIQNTKKQITKEQRTNGQNRQTTKPPTLDEIKAYVEERGLSTDPKQFYDYFTEGNWVDAKGQKVKNWKQKLLTWEKFNKPGQVKEPPKRPARFSDFLEEEIESDEEGNNPDIGDTTNVVSAILSEYAIE